MAQYSVENGNPHGTYPNLFGTDISASLGNRSINVSNNNAAGDSFVLVARHELRIGRVTMSVVVSGGTYTALSVGLQARVQGDDWVTLASMTDAAGGTVSADIEGFDEFRANKVSSTTDTGTPVVTADLAFN